METERLTLEIVMKYPNSKIIKSDSNNVMIRTIYPNFTNWMLSNPYDFQDISDAKLILRPLSSLTEEEKEEYIYKMNEYKNTLLGFEYNAKMYLVGNSFPVDYLRSINIDIDGLQEKGVAVYD